MRRVTLLGATGSVGTSTAEVIAEDPDRFEVHAVAALSSAEKLAEVARRLGARRAVVADKAAWLRLREALGGTGIVAEAGEDALQDAASDPVDITVSAIVGAAGVRATSAAVEAGNAIALANKECLICAGAAFMRLVRERGVDLLPVDSEHNALFQLLEGRDRSAIRTFTITASGGPFRTWPADRLARATPRDALAHPTWSMGDKITIDSATLMNKGLELIEAHYLFDIAPPQLDVLVHPQSVVHALVTFADGSMQADLGAADMRRPIAHCLYWPERRRPPFATLDLGALGSLTFERPDEARFPALRLARAALAAGAGAPTILNAANELAVGAFLNSRIAFTAIPAIVEETLLAAEARGLLREPDTIDGALALDAEARAIAAQHLREHMRAAT